MRPEPGHGGPPVPPPVDPGAATGLLSLSGVGEGGTITAGTACANCGYALTGLHVSGACPECSFSVADSIRGGLLATLPLAHLRRLQRGAGLVALSVVMWIPAILISAGLSVAGSMAGGAPDALLTLLENVLTTVLVWVPWLYGHWLLTSQVPAPSTDPGKRGLPKTVQVCVLIYAACTLISGIAEPISLALGFSTAGGINLTAGQNVTVIVFAVLGTIVGFAGLVSWVLAVICGMVYAGKLAKRVPDLALSARAKRSAWLLPLLTVAAVVPAAGAAGLWMGVALGGGMGGGAPPWTSWGMPLTIVLLVVAVVLWLVVMVRYGMLFRRLQLAVRTVADAAQRTLHAPPL